MKSIIKQLLWFSIPFILFLAGFFLAFFLFPRRYSTVPACIGKKAELAFAELSERGFSARCLLVTVENPALSGMVVDQLPEAGAQVYSGHTVRVTVGQQSITRRIPDFIGQQANTAKALAKECGYEITLVWLPHYRALGTCFAQSPRPHHVAQQGRIICYCSLGTTPYAVMPSLVGQTRESVEEFAQKNNALVQFVGGNAKTKNTTEKKVMFIVDQQPAAGTIIDSAKQLFIQVQVAEKH